MAGTASAARTLAAGALDALRDAAAEAGGLRVSDLALDSIHPDPEQPRSGLGDDADAATQKELRRLADNISAVGLQQPVRVRPRPAGEDGYTLIAGERRWRAAQLAGFDKIPAIVESQGSEPQARLLQQISENLQRSDLRLLDLAKALDRLCRDSELSDGELARMLGRSKAWFSQHLRPLRAAGLAREALNEDLVGSPEVLRLFEKLPEPRQRRLLAAAREARVPMSRAQVATSVGRAAAKPGHAGTKSQVKTGERLYTLRLDARGLRRIILALGSKPQRQADELVGQLRELLTAEGPAS